MLHRATYTSLYTCSVLWAAVFDKETERLITIWRGRCGSLGTSALLRRRTIHAAGHVISIYLYGVSPGGEKSVATFAANQAITQQRHIFANYKYC